MKKFYAFIVLLLYVGIDSSFAQPNTHNEFILPSAGPGSGHSEIMNKIIPLASNTMFPFAEVGDFQSTFLNSHGDRRRINLSFTDNNSNDILSNTYITNLELSLGYLTNQYTAKDVAEVSNGDLIICGDVIQGNDMDRYVYLLRVNPAGNVIWYKEYWMEDDYGSLTSVIPTTDGGFIACGYYVDDHTVGNYGKHARVMKTDGAGNLTWTKEVPSNLIVGGPSNTESFYNQVVDIGNNEYALVGSCNYSPLFSSDILLSYIDNGGNFTFNKAIGFFQNLNGDYVLEQGKSVYFDAPNNRLTILGSTENFLNGTCVYNADFLILKMDRTTHAIDYFNQYDFNNDEDYPSQIVVDVPANKIYAVGESNNRINSTFTSVLHTVDYATGISINTERYLYGNALSIRSVTIDNNTAPSYTRMVGNLSLAPFPPFNNGYYFIRTYTLGHTSTQCEDYASITEVPYPYVDDDLRNIDLARSYRSIDMQDLPFGPTKNVLCGTGNLTTSVKEESKSGGSINVYPNPAKNKLTVEGVKGLFRITNVLGQTMSIGTLPQKGMIDISELKTGIYFIEINNEGEKVMRIKFIKE